MEVKSKAAMWWKSLHLWEGADSNSGREMYAVKKDAEHVQIFSSGRGKDMLLPSYDT